MDETSLRALLERAVADEPPAGPIVSRSVEAGVRLRRRRRVRGARGLCGRGSGRRGGRPRAEDGFPPGSSLWVGGPADPVRHR
jgi:hypothetical protein